MNETYKGYDITIEQDESSMDPRVDFDNLGTLVCFHRDGYGDKHYFENPQEVMDHIKNTKAIWLPVYMYKHSGIALNTTGFSCPWDSGQLGVIFVDREKIYKDQQVKRITKSMVKKVEELLKGEVKIYGQYLNGEVYWYDIKNAFGNDEDSCGGFFGYDECLKAALEHIDSIQPNSIELIKSLKKGEVFKYTEAQD